MGRGGLVGGWGSGRVGQWAGGWGRWAGGRVDGLVG